MDEQARRWTGPAVPLSAAELADHHAVSQLCKIYAIGLDMRDYELTRSAFAPDATMHGRDGAKHVDVALKETYGVASSFNATQHVISNQYVDLKGDDAVCWSYGVAHHKRAPGDERDEIIAGVQYRDTCKRFAKGWLIVERKLHMHWMDMAPRRGGGA